MSKLIKACNWESMVTVVFLFLVAASLFLFVSFNQSVAQESSLSEHKTFTDLLSEFVSLAEQDSNIQLAIRFNTPMLDNQSTYIVPQFRDTEEGTSRNVSEIGDDYICFDTTSAGIRLIECIPFSNISGIDYLVQ